jgi:hypothetical protein
MVRQHDLDQLRSLRFPTNCSRLCRLHLHHRHQSHALPQRANPARLLHNQHSHHDHIPRPLPALQQAHRGRESPNLIEKRREADRGLPSAQDLDIIVAEREGGELHEQATRRAGRAAIHFTAHRPRPPKNKGLDRAAFGSHGQTDHNPTPPQNKRGPTPPTAEPPDTREKP